MPALQPLLLLRDKPQVTYVLVHTRQGRIVAISLTIRSLGPCRLQVKHLDLLVTKARPVTTSHIVPMLAFCLDSPVRAPPFGDNLTCSRRAERTAAHGRAS